MKANHAAEVEKLCNELSIAQHENKVSIKALELLTAQHVEDLICRQKSCNFMNYVQHLKSNVWIYVKIDVLQKKPEEIEETRSSVHAKDEKLIYLQPELNDSRLLLEQSAIREQNLKEEVLNLCQTTKEMAITINSIKQKPLSTRISERRSSESVSNH